jgi:Uri superfamily endonuclease
MVQGLEADVRQHIKLEHEMKIHMDYLEGKLEQFQNRETALVDQLDKTTIKLDIAMSKL